MFLNRLAALGLAAWWGGLTVYAAIVVPLGSRNIGVTEQGFITQQVTHWLNGLAAAALVLSGWTVWISGRRTLVVAWWGAAAALIGLVALHPQLDALLDETAHSVLDGVRFYGLHRVYLWVTALQWVAGLVLTWGLLGGGAAREPVGRDESRA